MQAITYQATADPAQAIADNQQPDSAFLAGGTTLLDLMKLNVENPAHLVDINALPLEKIETLPDGGVRIGALARNSDLAYHPFIERNYPALSQAILSGASPQLRNMATTAGNLLQRTRCYYFRDTASPCNKREPGSGCSAITGFNRNHAILGTSEKCIATHPSDMCVGMAIFDAVIRITGPDGDRNIPFNDFYVSYGDDPAKETQLKHGELITAVDLPPGSFFSRSGYLKVRDRAEYEFALSSAAVALDMDSGTIRQARIALGGVATKPWRAALAEAALAGKQATDLNYLAAAEAELKSAVPQSFNAFKIELCKRTIVRALQTVAALA